MNQTKLFTYQMKLLQNFVEMMEVAALRQGVWLYVSTCHKTLNAIDFNKNLTIANITLRLWSCVAVCIIWLRNTSRLFTNLRRFQYH